MSYSTLHFGYIDDGVGLGSGGTLPVSAGGTGVNSITGIVCGNGTLPFTSTPKPAGTVVGTSDTQTLTNKNLVDLSTKIVNSQDPSIAINFYTPFYAPELANTSLSIQSNQTSDGTINFPDIVGVDDVITANSANLFFGTNTFNNIATFNNGVTIRDNNFEIVDDLNLNSRIKFDSSAAGNAALTIRNHQTVSGALDIPDIGGGGSDTVALLSKAQTLANKSLVDASTLIVDDGDPTKAMKFQLAGSTAGTTLELQTNQTTSQSLAIPNITGADELLTAATTQTITGTKLHTGSLTVNDNTFFIRDQLGTTKRLKFEVSAGSNNCTLTIAGKQTSSRQIYIPNLTTDNDNFVTENTSQTMINKTLTSPIIDGTTNMPTLTASQAVVTDASKNLASLPYTELSTATSLCSRNANNEIYFQSAGLNFQSVASSNGTTTLAAHSAQIVVVTGSQPHTIRLPLTTSYAAVGRVFSISNRSSKSVRLESNSGGTIRSAVASATSINVVCNNVAVDGTGSWHIWGESQYCGRIQSNNGTAVEFQDSAPPSAGMVMTATSANTGEWQYPDSAFTDNVQTVGATTTTFGGTALPTGSVLNIKAYVVARNVNASTCLGYELFAVANNNAGTVTIIGGGVTATEKETNTLANATLIVSGTSVVVEVTGLSGQTIDWRCKIYTVAV